MKCMHCYTKIFNARTDTDGVEHWVKMGKNPGRFTLADLHCVPGSFLLTHRPIPEIKIQRVI